MRLVLQEFLSMDGVSQGPGSPDEDPSDGFTQGGWFVPHLDQAFDRVAATWLGLADAFGFGRRTYERFARDWPKMTDHLNAHILNGSPKIRRLPEPDQGWVGPDHDPVRRHPRPIRRVGAAARPRAPDPRKRPARPVAAVCRPDRRAAASDRPSCRWKRTSPVPGRRHPCRSAPAAQ